jgi:hypothetical protein
MNKSMNAPAVCKLPVRDTVDIGVMTNIKVCANLLSECATRLHEAEGGSPADEAQRAIFLNLGRCLFEAVYGMLVLLNHGARGAVLILERAAIEYYGRAKYFAKEPEHAVWVVEVERLQARLDTTTLTEEQRTASIREIAQARARNSQLSPDARIAAGKEPFYAIRILDMIRIGLGEEAARRYNSASSALHGNLYTSDVLKARPAEAMNGAVLEAGSGIVAFCRLMLSRLPHPPADLLERVDAADIETARLAKRYSRVHLIAASSEPAL